MQTNDSTLAVPTPVLSRTSLWHDGDVADAREANRTKRYRRMALGLTAVATWVFYRLATGNPVQLGLPSAPAGLADYGPSLGLMVVLIAIIGIPMLTMGRSPHVTYRPEEIGISLADVRGADLVVDEVVRSLNLFLGFKTFAERMGGTPRKALLFEGPPGTGKTYMAKAMAAEASVPFLFVSSTAFQSMYHGQTQRKLRAYFRALRKAARREGGAIGFIEEIDAIGGARAGMGSSTSREGIAGVVNELLVQLQSFDEPTTGQRFSTVLIEAVNRMLPTSRRLHRPASNIANVLVVAATNRAADLDPALLRPGRFDKSIYFDLPNRESRADILDYYLGRKAHTEDLDEPKVREQLVAATAGYSPVMLEHLLDESLICALREGRESMEPADVYRARMITELGIAQPASYTDAERERIAAHEAGHALIAYLQAPHRRLEVLSIIKRGQALGLLAHTDHEERFTQTDDELMSMIDIAMGGIAAEKLCYGNVSTGPSGDLAAATQIAATMIGTCGMGKSLVSYDAASIHGAGNIVAKVLAHDAARTEVDELLDSAHSRAQELLAEHRSTLEALRDELVARDELVGDEITDFIAASLQANA